MYPRLGRRHSGEHCRQVDSPDVTESAASDQSADWNWSDHSPAAACSPRCHNDVRWHTACPRGLRYRNAHRRPRSPQVAGKPRHSSPEHRRCNLAGQRRHHWRDRPAPVRHRCCRCCCNLERCNPERESGRSLAAADRCCIGRNRRRRRDRRRHLLFSRATGRFGTNCKLRPNSPTVRLPRIG